MTGKASLVVSTKTLRPDEAIAVPAARPMLDTEALEAFLLACRPSVTVLSIDGLDGYLTAILIGPKFIDPRLWLARLLGEATLLAEADTREHLALQAVVHHHNRLSATFSDQPDRYRPMFRPHRDGGLDPLYWWLGFAAAIELAPRAWKKVTDPRQPGRALFDPIYTATSGNGSVPGGTTEVVAKAVLDIRQHFQEQRRKSMR